MKKIDTHVLFPKIANPTGLKTDFNTTRDSIHWRSRP